MSTTQSALEELRSLPCEIEVSTTRANSGPYGDAPSVEVGPEVQAISITWTGPVEWVMGGYQAEKMLDSQEGIIVWHSPGSLNDAPADAAGRAAILRLLEACREESVALHVSHPSIGAKIDYVPRALRDAKELAEDIRITRIRAFESGHPAHHERLRELMDAVAGKGGISSMASPAPPAPSQLAPKS